MKRRLPFQKVMIGRMRWLRRQTVRLAVVGLVAMAAALVLWQAFGDSLIALTEFVQPRDSLVITDRDGLPLRLTRPDAEDRRWVRVEHVSPHLIAAVLSAEDQDFAEHSGVDWSETARGLVSVVMPGMRLSGGSTLTQQVVKMVYGRPHGLWDKPLEMLRAMALEEQMSKDEILEQYLNRIPFGDQIVGVARASEAYFGTGVDQLTVGQAAMLAGIPQGPSINEPRRHLPRALMRQRFVLSRMRATDAISETVYQAARATPPRVVTESTRPWIAPRFVDRALAEHLRRGRAHEGRLRTSLSLPLQQQTAETLRSATAALAGRGVTNGAAIVLHNQTGEILAYVGAALSKGEGGALDLLRARRQPGSSLKPFVYELLFEEGGSPATLLDDINTPMTGAGGVLFEAEDYDGRERGPVLARFALGASLNLAAIDAARRVGAGAVVQRLGALGFRVGAAETYGAAVALGGVDVSPIELSRAMMTLARGGTAISPQLFVGDVAQGTPVMTVMTESAAALTVDILMDGTVRRNAFGDDLESLADGPFGLKTGTSSGWHDAWSSTFDEDFTVVVWLGDPGGAGLAEVSGFSGAAPIAARILGHARSMIDPRASQRSNTAGHPMLDSAIVCSLSGRLPSPGCTAVHRERFATGGSPEQRCQLHQSDGSVVLPPQYQRWAAAMQRARLTTSTSDREQDASNLRFAHPTDGARLLIDPRRVFELPLRAVRGHHTVDAEFVVNGQPLRIWIPTAGVHRIEAIHAGERVQIEVTVEDTPIR